jgi:hypothetical protein
VMYSRNGLEEVGKVVETRQRKLNQVVDLHLLLLT